MMPIEFWLGTEQRSFPSPPPVARIRAVKLIVPLARLASNQENEADALQSAFDVIDNVRADMRAHKINFIGAKSWKLE
jgi:hypothetical protein